jgi:quercetin dioxygenase-like cupin family protein
MFSVSDLMRPHDVALRLPARFDDRLLEQDLAAIDAGWWANHLSDYHDGNWQSISLYAPRGDRSNQFSFGGDFAPTEALSRCSYLPQVIDALPGRKSRVRLLRLRPGGRIYEHSDPLHQIDRHLVRLHVPIQTSVDVDFRVGGMRLEMRPGETWFVDVRFRHSVENRGTADRVHLVVDAIANDELTRLLADSESPGKGYLTPYFLKHSLPTRLLRWLGIAN